MAQGGQVVGPTQNDVMLEQQRMLNESMRELAKNWVSMVNTQKQLDAAKWEVRVNNLGTQFVNAYKASGFDSMAAFATSQEGLVRAYLTAMDLSKGTQDEMIGNMKSMPWTPDDWQRILALYGRTPNDENGTVNEMRKRAGEALAYAGIGTGGEEQGGGGTSGEYPSFPRTTGAKGLGPAPAAASAPAAAPAGAAAGAAAVAPEAGAPTTARYASYGIQPEGVTPSAPQVPAQASFMQAQGAPTEAARTRVQVPDTMRWMQPGGANSGPVASFTQESAYPPSTPEDNARLQTMRAQPAQPIVLGKTPYYERGGTMAAQSYTPLEVPRNADPSLHDMTATSSRVAELQKAVDGGSVPRDVAQAIASMPVVQSEAVGVAVARTAAQTGVVPPEAVGTAGKVTTKLVESVKNLAQSKKAKSSDIAAVRKASFDMARFIKDYPQFATGYLEAGVESARSQEATDYQARFNPSTEVTERLRLQTEVPLQAANLMLEAKKTNLQGRQVKIAEAEESREAALFTEKKNQLTAQTDNLRATTDEIKQRIAAAPEEQKQKGLVIEAQLKNLANEAKRIDSEISLNIARLKTETNAQEIDRIRLDIEKGNQKLAERNAEIAAQQLEVYKLTTQNTADQIAMEKELQPLKIEAEKARAEADIAMANATLEEARIKAKYMPGIYEAELKTAEATLSAANAGIITEQIRQQTAMAEIDAMKLKPQWDAIVNMDNSALDLLTKAMNTKGQTIEQQKAAVEAYNAAVDAENKLYKQMFPNLNINFRDYLTVEDVKGGIFGQRTMGVMLYKSTEWLSMAQQRGLKSGATVSWDKTGAAAGAAVAQPNPNAGGTVPGPRSATTPAPSASSKAKDDLLSTYTSP